MDDNHSTTQSIAQLWPVGAWIRRNWRVIASVLASAVITSGGWLASMAFNAGKHASEDAALVAKIDEMAKKIDKHAEQQIAANEHLARMDEHMTSIDGHIAGLEAWRNGEGVPVFSTKRRAH